MVLNEVRWLLALAGKGTVSLFSDRDLMRPPLWPRWSVTFCFLNMSNWEGREGGLEWDGMLGP